MAGGGCLKGWMRGKACQPLLRELKLKYCKLQLFSMGWFVIPPSQSTPHPTERLEALAEALALLHHTFS